MLKTLPRELIAPETNLPLLSEGQLCEEKAKDLGLRLYRSYSKQPSSHNGESRSTVYPTQTTISAVRAGFTSPEEIIKKDISGALGGTLTDSPCLRTAG